MYGRLVLLGPISTARELCGCSETCIANNYFVPNLHLSAPVKKCEIGQL